MPPNHGVSQAAGHRCPSNHGISHASGHMCPPKMASVMSPSFHSPRGWRSTDKAPSHVPPSATHFTHLEADKSLMNPSLKRALDIFPPVLALITDGYVWMNTQHGRQLVSESQKVDFPCFVWSKSVQTQGDGRLVHELSGKELVFRFYCPTRIILAHALVSRIYTTSN